ncbi:hypothetical protein ACQUW5_13425 [Legionella sp. CNM-1927-20]|uniref:hypothetical protein n=1 Tax=Legionella sp. CNM-1927-20 TaxID=3422221 RepID=UPI00403AD50A
MCGGHIALLANYYNNKNPPDTLGYALVGFHGVGGEGYCSHRFLNVSLALHTLSFIQDEELIAKLVKAIKKDGRMYEAYQYNIDEVVKKSSTIKNIMKNYGLAYDKACYCLDKSGEITAIKTAQLMQIYDISEKQASQWVTNPSIRAWFRDVHYSIKKRGNFLQTDNITNLINEYVLGENAKESSEFKAKITPNKISQLTALTPLAFFKPSVVVEKDESFISKISHKFK